jgi:hypothetical protein
VPLVSVILPVYNRADVVDRALASVRAQAVDDLEIVCVDDGSTDGSGERVAAADPRVVLLRQENGGVAAARNAGLAAARGELVAFLDSDDEWPAHHLALAAAFFAAHPGAQACSSEFWQDWGRGCVVKHFREQAGTWFPDRARLAGLSTYAGPARDGDGYLRVWEEAAPVGAWGSALAAAAGHADARHYRGVVHRHWRFGYLLAMQPTVIRREAALANGPFDVGLRAGSDFGWLARLCRQEVHYLSLPGCVKHEWGVGGARLAQDHLATGGNQARFFRSLADQVTALFPEDPDLPAIRAVHLLDAAGAAAREGRRAEAHAALAEAADALPALPGALAMAARLTHLPGAPWLVSETIRGAWLARQAVNKARRVVGLG